MSEVVPQVIFFKSQLVAQFAMLNITKLTFENLQQVAQASNKRQT